MRKILLLFLCILVACAPVSEPEVAPVSSKAPIVEPVVQSKTVPSEFVTRTVKQSGSLGTFVYGLSEDNRLLRVEKTGEVWEYKYENGLLKEVSGPENVEFLYSQNRLSDIDSGATKLSFTYDSLGKLMEIKGFAETLHMEYDSLYQLRSVKRGVAGETSIDYDKQGLIKYLTRGLRTTNVFYDDKNRVRNFDADDSKFIIGYWRDDKVISLTGITFGKGLTVSYGPDYPPFEAKIVHEGDDSTFTSAYTDTLYKVVDQYVYCKYVRRLKDLLFDGISYSFYVNYFKGDLPGYLAMQFACRPYET